MQKIVPFLWFNNQAEEAMNFYTGVFKDSKIVAVNRLPGDGSYNMVMGTFEIAGQEFYVLDGGPQFKFNPAISLFVNCETQEEVDHLWERLLEGGKPDQCGWLTDKFGLSWQIVPTTLGRLMNDPNKKKAKAVMDAMMKMIKIESSELERAYENA